VNEIFENLPWNKKLEVLRVALGFTQTELANKCLTNQKVYWSWEAGARYPRKIYREKLSTIFSVPENEIFKDSDHTKKRGGDVC